MIYFQSIIDIPNFYKTCVLISYKTSNSQSDIENMPYYVFNNFITYLNEILEEENKGSEKDSATPQNMMGSMRQQASGMFSKSMSGMRGSMPKIK